MYYKHVRGRGSVRPIRKGITSYTTRYTVIQALGDYKQQIADFHSKKDATDYIKILELDNLYNYSILEITTKRKAK